jgi:transposase
MGRKNYLFCWSELGAEQLGILQSLMITCRIQGINPYTYLVNLLQRVGLNPAKDVLDLVPRVWKTKFADNPLKSDLSIPTSSYREFTLTAMVFYRLFANFKIRLIMIAYL